MLVWLTKYALTTGIFQLEGDYTDDGKYFSGKSAIGEAKFFVNIKDIVISKNDAERDFYARRYKKIKAIERQLNKLEKQKPKFIE